MSQDRFSNDVLPAASPQSSIAGEMLAAGQALQQVRTSYATAIAVQKPRELAQVRHRLLEESRLAGEDFYYGWGDGKDKIEGPSVQLALAAARCWGNCAVEPMPLQNTLDSWIFSASFIDLETGFTLGRQFRQAKDWKVYGKLDDARKDDIRFQIGQSKAIRNVVLNALPRFLIDKAIEEAKKGVKEKIEKFIQSKGMPAAVDLLIKELGKVGVTEERILEKIGVAKREALDLDHLVTLRGDLSALQSGQERVDTLFPPKDQPKSGPPTGKIDLRNGTNGAAPKEEQPKDEPEPAMSEATDF